CDDSRQEVLSERETDVLVQLLKGLSNKEIAEKLHISKHTVISHRKNIVEKTGIKSLPGLTIYAISKKIIPVDSR
ncbi:MAG: response regulator transcription factor, partial [Bacteroidota bacterium]